MSRWPWIAATLVGLVDCGGSTAGDGNTGGSGGVSPELTSCSVNSDCLISPASCCGSCGAATRGDAIALNKNQVTHYSEQVCEGGGCPACYSPQDPMLIATCDAGQCKVVDLLQHPATACQTAADCRLRTNTCCECTGPIDYDQLLSIAIGGDAELAKLICDPVTPCDDCDRLYPPLALECASGHCRISPSN